MITRLHPGPRFCQAVVANGVVTTAGIVAKDSHGDAKAQTRDILTQIDALLAEAGSSVSRLLTANIWLSNMDNFKAMNEIWDGWVDRNNLPVRATVEARLATPEYLVEIQVTALV
jgi:enamine deaminase RidA (YjgF/YER057c/UK114 family)